MSHELTNAYQQEHLAEQLRQAYTFFLLRDTLMKLKIGLVEAWNKYPITPEKV